MAASLSERESTTANVGIGFHRRPSDGLRGSSPAAVLTAHELVAKSLAVGLNEPRGRMRKVDWQYEAAGSRHLAEKAPARPRRFLGVPIKDRRPARFAALQRVVPEIADHHGV